MAKWIWNNIDNFILMAFFMYEYMFRGYQVLVKGKELSIFPDSLVKISSKIFPSIHYKFNLSKQKQLAFSGLIVSSWIVFSFFYSLYLVLLF